MLSPPHRPASSPHIRVLKGHVISMASLKSKEWFMHYFFSKIGSVQGNLNPFYFNSGESVTIKVVMKEGLRG